MIRDLGWLPLADRRRIHRLAYLFQIMHHEIDINPGHLPQTVYGDLPPRRCAPPENCPSFCSWRRSALSCFFRGRRSALPSFFIGRRSALPCHNKMPLHVINMLFYYILSLFFYDNIDCSLTTNINKAL